MEDLKRAVVTELLKLKHLNIVWITFFAFALGPFFGGLIMFLLKNPELIPKSGILNTKMAILADSVNWNAYFEILSQVMAIGGIIVFGFIGSYIFGREYSDHVYRDILALPVARSTILNAKFIVYFIWSLSLSISNLIFGLLIGSLLNLAGWEYLIVYTNLKVYLITALLTILLGLFIPFFALWSRGFLVPLAFLVLTLIFAQIIPIVGGGYYFPWSIPSIYSGAAGEALKYKLNIWSYLILFFTVFLAYLLSIYWWNNSDQN